MSDNVMKKQKNGLDWYENVEKEVAAKKKKHTEKKKAKSAKKDTGMNKQTAVNLEKYSMDAAQWIDEIAVLMRVGDRKDVAWNALRGVLHAIRDRLAPEEVFHLSAQLPMLIRGLYFESYQLSEKPEKFHLDEMVTRIEDTLGPALDINAEQAFKAVLLVLYDHVSKGQLNDMYGAMPKDIRGLWDKSIKSYSV